jgi:hypothetical protein
MQYGPDGLPVSNVSILTGQPTDTPAPVPVTTTETFLGPLIYDPGSTQIPANLLNNIKVDVPYAVAVADDGNLISNKAYLLNFQGSGVTVTQAGKGLITINITNASIFGSLNPGTGIGLTESGVITTITNSGVTSITGNTGISVSSSTGATAITNTGVTSIVAGTGISVSGGTGVVTVSANYSESVYNAGNSGSTITPNRTQGSVQKFTLNAPIVTLNTPTNMSTGQNLTLIFTQDSTGNRALNANASYLFASGFQTLSTSSGAIDMLNIFYDGSVYYVTLTVGYS